MNHLTTNGEAGISLHKQKEKLPLEGFNGRGGNSVLDGNNGRSCCYENCGEKDIAGSSSSQPDVVCVSEPLGFLMHLRYMIVGNTNRGSMFYL